MRSNHVNPRQARFVLLLLIAASTSGCYYLQAATGHWQVMRKRAPITEVIASQQTPAELRERLRLVQAARRFSVDQLGLPDNESYASFADIEREFVVWNVVAAREFSLEPKRWCFPVAGCVSYRGYFSEDAAEKSARRLGDSGFDVLVGGVSAYSTLGKFDDPLLSSMMRWDDVRLVGVLFHELAHQVLYVQDDSGFNESFASAVEEFGLERWLVSQGKPEALESYRQRRTLREQMMAYVADARIDLRKIYTLPVEAADKRDRKAARLAQLKTDVAELLRRAGQSDAAWLELDLNNARLVSMNVYQGHLPAFRALLERCDGDMRCFYEEATALSELEKPARNRALDALARGNLADVVGSAHH